jgi:mycothiol synthase
MLTYRPLTSEELRPSLRFVLDRDGSSKADLEGQVNSLLRYVAASGLSIDRQWGAFEDRRLVAACLSVVSPGHSAMVFLPETSGRQGGGPVLVELLRHIVADAPACGVRLLQAMAPPGSSREESILSEAGFTFLAELIYMDRDVAALFSSVPASLRLSWVTYSEERRLLFAESVAATYEGSLDCPGLSGVRTIEDVMASHRAVGEFNERHWFVVMDGDVPAGVLLLARIPPRNSMDVVYMGLLPQYRGRGLGRAILHQAVKVARDCGCVLVTLAVDAANTPAVRLYGACGFTETTRRRAWIIVPAHVSLTRCAEPTG